MWINSQTKALLWSTEPLKPNMRAGLGNSGKVSLLSQKQGLFQTELPTGSLKLEPQRLKLHVFFGKQDGADTGSRFSANRLVCLQHGVCFSRQPAHLQRQTWCRPEELYGGRSGLQVTMRCLW